MFKNDQERCFFCEKVFHSEDIDFISNYLRTCYDYNRSYKKVIKALFELNNKPIIPLAQIDIRQEFVCDSCSLSVNKQLDQVA